jgi:hypothetical protein
VAAPRTAGELEELLRPAPDAPRLAGVPVRREDVEFLRPFFAGESDESLSLRVAARRVLAGKALDRGLGDEFGVESAYRKALAQAFLRLKFEQELTADTVPLSTWEEVYRNPAIFPRFDHQNSYFVIDAQFICCRGQVRLCANDEGVKTCLRDYEPEAWKIHALLAEQNTRTPEEFEARTKALSEAEFPRLAVHHYSFQFNFNLPREKQRGYDVVSEAVALAARDTPPGSFSKPARSEFGWHILYVKRFLPEVHRKFEEPDVLESLKADFFPTVRRNEVIVYFTELMKRADVRVFEEALRELDWARISGLK